MKKIISLFLTFFMTLALVGCANQKNKDDILSFFDAFHETLDASSGQIQGTITLKNEDTSSMRFDLSFSQKETIDLAFEMGIQANDQIEDDFLNFYIHDGKTYLNSMGVKTQSLAENIGIMPGQKLSFNDPFLSYTDDQLINFFDSSKKEKGTFIYEIKPKQIEKLLDSFGTIRISTARLETTQSKGLLKTLKLRLIGEQHINDKEAIIDVTIDCTFKNINQDLQITFPSDLESYQK